MSTRCSHDEGKLTIHNVTSVPIFSNGKCRITPLKDVRVGDFMATDYLCDSSGNVLHCVMTRIEEIEGQAIRLAIAYRNDGEKRAPHEWDKRMHRDG